MRTRELFGDNWLFHKGDIHVERPKDKGPMYVQAKTERFRMGPAAIYYSDTPDSFEIDRVFPSERWEYVRLPHDYVVEGTPDAEENNALGYLRYDNAWYRKRFSLAKEDAGKRLVLEFEGVSDNSTVYLNGCLMKHNFCGYTSFEVDITDYAVCGGENVLAVYIDLSNHEGWWYEGGGIYRNVWLLKTDEVAVDTYGVYVAPEKLTDTKWRVKIETTVVSKAYDTQSVSLLTEIIDQDGNAIANARGAVCVASHTNATAKYEVEVEAPHLWDIDDPYIYNVRTRVFRGNDVCDEYMTRTGFRYFVCDAQQGFFLNGRCVKIKGVCVHEDCGLLGKAIPDNVHR